MNVFKQSLKILEDLFQKDYQFALATCDEDKPSARFVDTYYKKEAFWIVTYRSSRKVKDILKNPNVELCYRLYSFSGKAYDMGHPLKAENSEIRDELIKAFEPWYFAHNDENDENMCYIKVIPEVGFFYKDGIAYKVDFIAKEATTFPFEDTIVITN